LDAHAAKKGVLLALKKGWTHVRDLLCIYTEKRIRFLGRIATSTEEGSYRGNDTKESEGSTTVNIVPASNGIRKKGGVKKGGISGGEQAGLDTDKPGEVNKPHRDEGGDPHPGSH